jgi:four helix bundle protein
MNPTISNYRSLLVWQKAMALAAEIYRLTAAYPRVETYGLVSQMRRCAVSVPSNIAEGSKRGTRKDYRHFLYIAYGSGAELETQLALAKTLGMGAELSQEKAVALLDEVMRMLNTMTNKLQ